jgi:hypothetical protein
MGMFTKLMSKIFGHVSSQSTKTTTPTATRPAAPPVMASNTPSPATAAAAAPAPVDVTAILDGLAAKNCEKLDWKKSIVDLLKLVGMDSSLSARKELASELNYSGDQSDSAAMNIWLHKQVLKSWRRMGATFRQICSISPTPRRCALSGATIAVCSIHRCDNCACTTREGASGLSELNQRLRAVCRDS